MAVHGARGRGGGIFRGSWRGWSMVFPWVTTFRCKKMSLRRTCGRHRAAQGASSTGPFDPLEKTAMDRRGHLASRNALQGKLIANHQAAALE